MLDPMQVFFENGIVPVVILDDADKAVFLARALLRGGISTIELTLRTEAGIKAIENVRRAVPEILVGAGTVSSCEKAQRAVEAGAQYIISPGLNISVIDWCRNRGIPVYPGVSTPTEIEAALELGLTELKFFPAEAAGGTKMVKALASPYGNVKFMPTGGVSPSNLMSYLSLPNVVACGGSWICPQEYIEAERYEEIECATREAVRQIHGFELSHIGINSISKNDAKDTADTFSRLFLTETTETDKAYFAGEIVEILKKPYLGGKGHICISVNNFKRATAFLKKQGVEFLEEGYTEGDVAYLKNELAGFAVHIKQKK